MAATQEEPAALPVQCFSDAPVESDGTTDLALMATEHPDIKRFGDAIFEQLGATNALLRRCAPWIQAGEFPEAVIDAHQSVQAILGTVHKEIELVDSIDLAALKPAWGDKATVRMARKTLISFAQEVMDRLEDLQARLAAPTAKSKEEQRLQREAAARAKRTALPGGEGRDTKEEEPSLAEKYRHILRPTESEKENDTQIGIPEQRQRLHRESLENSFFMDRDGGSGRLPPPPAKRARAAATASDRAEGLPTAEAAAAAAASDVQAKLRNLQAKVGQPLKTESLATFTRQLRNFATIPDFAADPAICRSGIECALSAVHSTLSEDPGPKVLAGLLAALRRIESLREPAGLPAVLSDLSEVVRAALA